VARAPRNATHCGPGRRQAGAPEGAPGASALRVGRQPRGPHDLGVQREQREAAALGARSRDEAAVTLGGARAVAGAGVGASALTKTARTRVFVSTLKEEVTRYEVTAVGADGGPAGKQVRAPRRPRCAAPRRRRSRSAPPLGGSATSGVNVNYLMSPGSRYFRATPSSRC